MKYKHPKLPRHAIETDGMENHFHIMFKEILLIRSVTKETVEALGFEPVEETPDWIMKAYIDFVETVCPTVAGTNTFINNRRSKVILSSDEFMKAILKHMPKQDKITVDDIDDFERSYSQKQTFAYTPRGFAINLLRDKGLLQE